MELNKFIEDVLVGIAHGVKSTNDKIENDSAEPTFALKNAGWYVNQDNGCVWFNLAVVSKGNKVIVVNSQKDSRVSDVSTIKFNIVKVHAIS
jgi:hypothetical protein